MTKTLSKITIAGLVLGLGLQTGHGMDEPTPKSEIRNPAISNQEKEQVLKKYDRWCKIEENRSYIYQPNSGEIRNYYSLKPLYESIQAKRNEIYEDLTTFAKHQAMIFGLSGAAVITRVPLRYSLPVISTLALLNVAADCCFHGFGSHLRFNTMEPPMLWAEARLGDFDKSNKDLFNKSMFWSYCFPAAVTSALVSSGPLYMLWHNASFLNPAHRTHQRTILGSIVLGVAAQCVLSHYWREQYTPLENHAT